MHTGVTHFGLLHREEIHRQLHRQTETQETQIHGVWAMLHIQVYIGIAQHYNTLIDNELG
jgi:hypothetical protein